MHASLFRLWQWKKLIFSTDLLFLSAAVILSTTLLVGLSQLESRLQQTIQSLRIQTLAADFRITHPSFENQQEELTQIVQQYLGNTTESSVLINFNSMVYLTSEEDGGDEVGILAWVKGLDEHYPLKGDLVVQQHGKQQVLKGGPAQGKAWIDAQMQAEAGLAIGDSLWVGELELKLSGILVSDPSVALNGISGFLPQVIIPYDQAKQTGVVGEGGRFSHHLLYNLANATKEQAFKSLEEELELRANGENVRRPESDENIQQVRNLLLLLSLIALGLTMYTMVTSTRRFCYQQTPFLLVTKALGIKPTALVVHYAIILLILGVILGVIGWSLSQFMDSVLAKQLELFTGVSSLQPSFLETLPLLSVLFMVFFVNCGLSLWELIQDNVSTLQRKKKSPAGEGGGWQSWAMAGLLVLVLLWYAKDLSLLIWISALMITSVILIGLGVGLLSVMIRVLGASSNSFLRLTGFALLAHRKLTLGIFLSVSLLLTPLATVNSIQTQLFDRLDNIFPEDRPDHFLLNIFPFSKEGVLKLLEKHEVQDIQMAPELRFRLDSTSQDELNEWMKRRKNTTLRVSIAEDLPSGNEVVEGEWWPEIQGPQISIAQEFAKDADLTIGDTITMSQSGSLHSFTITSIRSVQWEDMSLNFWLLVRPQDVSTIPRIYISSLRLEPKNPANKEDSQAKTLAFKQDLRSSFPEVSLFSLKRVVEFTQERIDDLQVLINVVVIATTIAAGLALFQLIIESTSFLRKFFAVSRVLGATKRQASWSLYLTLLGLATLAGVIAGLLGQGGSMIWFSLSSIQTSFLPLDLLETAVLGFGFVAIFALPSLYYLRQVKPYDLLKS